MQGSYLRRAGLALVAFSGAATLLAPGRVAAFEFFDGKLSVHGFFESQLRAINADFSEQFDVTQWYQILNIETELDILDDTMGILDLMSAYLRVEVRFDCIYSRGCGMFRSMNAYGDRSKSLPRRLNNAVRRFGIGGFALSDRVAALQEAWPDANFDRYEETRRSGESRDPAPLSQATGFVILADGKGADLIRNHFIRDTPVFSDGDPNPLVRDDPFPLEFTNFQDYRFAQINSRGGTNYGLPTTLLAPWLPKNKSFPNAGLANIVNPFDSSDRSAALARNAHNAAVYESTGFDPDGTQSGGEILSEFEALWTSLPDDRRDAARAAGMTAATEARGATARFFRPIPILDAGGFGDDSPNARGQYYPSRPLQQLLAGEGIDRLPFNISESRRQWNYGESQRQTHVLKEAYFDVELFDSRLWLRVGKQTIVWGKTELFRNMDQFNPQDLALATLPTLEESRIPLWAVRGVWAFYEVGPFQDVRLELAFNFDEYQPNDLGACGEPYTPNPACVVSGAAFAHANAGFGVVGWQKPEAPWQSLRGWEIGGRLEWRWERFSFAVSDFWGYADVPYPDMISSYARNVDPATGRPRVIGATGPCTTQDPIFDQDTPIGVAVQPGQVDPDCLRPGPTARLGPLNADDPPPTFGDTTYRGAGNRNSVFADSSDPLYVDHNALQFHHANIQIFSMICSSSIGFAASLDPAACGQSVFNSTRELIPGVTLVSGIGAVLSGGPAARLAISVLFPGVSAPLVTLNRDPADDDPGFDCWDNSLTGLDTRGRNCNLAGSNPTFSNANNSLSLRLTAQQEALLGCGPFWGTNCDDSGVDLLNTSASVMLQSFAGFDRAGGYPAAWTTCYPARRCMAGTTGDFAPQPGTLGFDGGPVGTVYAPSITANRAIRLPGARGLRSIDDPIQTLRYSPFVDGCVAPVDPRTGAAIPGCGSAAELRHPFTGQLFENELAALSWNLMLFITLAGQDFDPDTEGGCNFGTPQFCDAIESFFDITGLQRNVVRAGGENGRFGRRTFEWHSGSEALLRFEKRNVLGFALDFAEDWSKSNFSIEATWVHDTPMANNDSFDGITRVDQYNLTLSVDRPTFVNFLNANRTFLVNTQWFFQYLDGYEKGFTSNGPWNILATLLVTTGYYQDRLLPTLTFVYDFQSVSGAAIPQLSYRFTENFSATIGAAFFLGRTQLVDMPLNPLPAAGHRQGERAYQDGVENGLSVLRDRDELFLRLRYTF